MLRGLLEQFLVSDLAALDADDGMKGNFDVWDLFHWQIEQNAEHASRHRLVNHQKVVLAVKVESRQGATNAANEIDVTLSVWISVAEFVPLSLFVLCRVMFFNVIEREAVKVAGADLVQVGVLVGIDSR